MCSSIPWIQGLHARSEEKICSGNAPREVPQIQSIVSQLIPYLRLQKAMLRDNIKVKKILKEPAVLMHEEVWQIGKKKNKTENNCLFSEV